MIAKGGAERGFAALDSMVTDLGTPTAPVASQSPARSDHALQPASSETADPRDAERTYLQLPKAFGEFGRVPSNPIPLASSKLAMLAYLGSLRADDGKFGRRVSMRDLGLTSCPEVTAHPILVCQVTPFKEAGEPDIPPVDLFLVSKFEYNTSKLPTGFHYFETRCDRGRNTVCMNCGSIIEIIPATFDGCPHCRLRQGGSVMENHRYFASLAAFSDIHWTEAQMRAIGSAISRRKEAPPEAKKLLNIYFTELVAKENREKFQMPMRRIHLK